ncbi:MAG: GNAT family N-acetyltransferase [Rubrobacter sp.]|nr:GNAT family N-acetyltransferase [Rubrobacter sp.]
MREKTSRSGGASPIGGGVSPDGSMSVDSVRRAEINVPGCDRLPGVEKAAIREATAEDAAGIARVHIASWRTAYRGIVPDAFLDGMSREESEARWRERLDERAPRVFFFVAEVSGSIVGFAVGGARRSESLTEFDGELYALYLLADARGMGIGRRLLRAVAEGLSSLGFRSMLACLMAGNRSACGFYEAFGGRLVGSDTFEISGETIEEVAYGWDDVRGLVEAPD